MNMISTGSFLTETSASTKQSELVKTLTSAWEKKNSKAARAGGVSLMALSLAACGSSEDTTPFSQADVDAAVAAAEATAAAAATAAAEAAAAAQAAAVAAAEATAADAAAAAATAAAADKAAAVAAAEATAAEAAAAAAAELAAVQAQLTALQNPAAQSLALTSSADILTGAGGNDTFTATSSTYGTGDVVIGGEGADVLNIAATGNISAATSVTGVETINVNAAVFSTATYDATGVTGATINFNNTQTGGATSATINNVGSNNTIVAGTNVTGTVTVDLTSSASGTTINAGAARIIAVTDAGSGGVTVTQTNTGTSVSGTTDNEISVDGDGDVPGDSATISSNGVITLETAATNQVEYLTLSGNTAAATYTITAGNAPEKVTFTGDQNVTLSIAALDATTETFLDTTGASATATLKINADDTADLSAVATSIVIDIADGTTGGKTYSLADNATVKLTADTTGTLDTTVASNGSTETLNLIVDDAGDQTSLNISDFEVVNVSGSDAAVTGDGVATIATMTGAATTNVYASGSVNLALGTTAAVAKLIDASAMTGKLTTTMSTNSTKVYGGEGNDTITGWAGNMTVDGNGGSDTLVFTGSTNLTGATLSLTDLETISVSLAGAATLQMNGSDVTGQSWIVKGTGTEDTLDITLDAASGDFSGLVIDDSTIAVTYTETAISGVAHTFTMTNADDTFSSAATAGASTINAGAGADSITTGTGADVINGQAGNDTIDANSGANVLTGGAGNDVFVIAAGDSTETTYTKITDFGVATGSFTQSAANDTAAEFQSTGGAGLSSTIDVLDLDSSTGVTFEANASLVASANGTANVKYSVSAGIITLSGTGAAAIDTLGEWIDEVEDIVTGTDDEVAAFEFNGNTYVFQNDTGAGGDLVVELTGLTGVAGLDDIVALNTTVTGGENYLLIA